MSTFKLDPRHYIAFDQKCERSPNDNRHFLRFKTARRIPLSFSHNTWVIRVFRCEFCNYARLSYDMEISYA